MDTTMVDSVEIDMRNLCAATGPLDHFGQIHIIEQGRLQLIQPAIESKPIMLVFGGLTVIAKDFDSIVPGSIIGEDCAAISHGSEVLCRIKASSRHLASRAGPFSIEGRQDGLGAILYHADVELVL